MLFNEHTLQFGSLCRMRSNSPGEHAAGSNVTLLDTAFNV